MSAVTDRLAGKITDAEALKGDAVILTLRDAQEIFSLATSPNARTSQRERIEKQQARIEVLQAQLRDLQLRHGMPQLRTWREQQARIEELEAALAAGGPQEYGATWQNPGGYVHGPYASREQVEAHWGPEGLDELKRGGKIVARRMAGPWTEVQA